MKKTAFLDTNVLVSAFLSANGAARFLLDIAQNNQALELYTSTHCLQEFREVVKRGKIAGDLDQFLLEYSCLQIVELDNSVKYDADLVFKAEDAHVLLAGVEANAQFLLTFNLKNFAIDMIKDRLRVKVMTQGAFLQMLRQLGLAA